MLCADDVETVSGLVRDAHARGVAVEGELGTLPDANDASRASLTDPEEAAAFVDATGVDCLAVSFGNVHVLEGRTAAVDLDRLDAVHRRVGVPLVVHGGTSFPASAVEAAIAARRGEVQRRHGAQARVPRRADGVRRDVRARREPARPARLARLRPTCSAPARTE